VTRPAGDLRRPAANAFWMLAAELGGKLAGLAFFVVVARGLGPEDFGYFTFAISFVPLFLVFANWGMPSALVREIARDRDRVSELFASGLAVLGSLGALGLLVAFAVALFLADGVEPYLAIVVVGVALFVDELASFLGTVFKGFERMQFHALVVFANRVLSTVLAAVALMFGADLLTVCFTYLAGSLGGLVFGAYALVRYFPPISLRSARRATARELLRIGTPLGIAGFFSTAVYRVDSVLLGAIKGPLQLALYGVAYRFFESLLFVTWALSNVALPRMARADRGEATRIYELTTAVLLAVYLPFAVVAQFAGQWLVTAVFGTEYEAAGPIVPILAWAAVFYGIAHFNRMASIALGHGSALPWISGSALALNVAANVVAIPRYGFEGAAWTTLATEALTAAALIGLFARVHERPRVMKVVTVPLLAAGALSVLLAAAGLRDLAAVVVALVAYPPLLAVSAMGLASAEVRLLRELLRRAPGDVPVMGVDVTEGVP
jgi:O-antigen/teichoic acid export membrane protein